MDAAGLRDGFILLRWQQMPVDAKAEDLLKSFKIIKLKNGIPDGLMRVTPQQRAAQLAAHKMDMPTDWRRRSRDPVPTSSEDRQ
jgi:hypothetical protein